MKPTKHYLGDSVYGSFDEVGQIVLTTENGLPSDPSNEIFLEPEVVVAFFRFACANSPAAQRFMEQQMQLAIRIKEIAT